MPDEEFKATIIRMLTGLEKRMEDISETLTIEIKEFKRNHNPGRELSPEITTKNMDQVW